MFLSFWFFLLITQEPAWPIKIFDTFSVSQTIYFKIIIPFLWQCFVLFCFLFLCFHFYCPVLGTGGWKNTQRQPPVPSLANYWYMSIRCSCKQLKFTVSKQWVPIQQTQRGASRYLGKGNNDKAYIRSFKKTNRKDKEQWIGQPQP